MTTNISANAHARNSAFVCCPNFASHSSNFGQTEQYPIRPVFRRTTTPNELLREMQGLQIRTSPASTGHYNNINDSSSKRDLDQEMLTPPSTPAKAKLEEQFPSRRSLDASHVSQFNFSPDLSQAQLLGEGVWSKVYRIPAILLPQMHIGRPLTPPSTPHKGTFELADHYAIKTATRSDAAAVFEAEARILTHIQTHHSSSDYVVPFLGLCNTTSTPSLLFHCADAGTLESQTTTQLSSPQALDFFLHILPQLTHALAFLHNTTNTIHADIKPANILLTSTSSMPLARFADFSTSFTASSTPPSHAGAGTWSFMAPEQLSREPELSTPTFASDVYSLGITLLGILCGGNPFAAMQDNAFRLREAIKMGDAISFSMQDPAFESRLAVLQDLWTEKGGQGNLLALVAVALKKKREERVTAEQWCGKIDAALANLKREEMVGLGIRC